MITLEEVDALKDIAQSKALEIFNAVEAITMTSTEAISGALTCAALVSASFIEAYIKHGRRNGVQMDLDKTITEFIKEIKLWAEDLK